MHVYKIEASDKNYFIAAETIADAVKYFTEKYRNENDIQVTNISNKNINTNIDLKTFTLPLNSLLKFLEITGPIEISELSKIINTLESLDGNTIYISGPYSAPTEEEREANTVRAMEAGLKALQKGYYPIIPHLMHYFDKYIRETGNYLSWSDYLEWDLVLLMGCTHFLYLDSSPGADVELAFAKNMGLPIYYSTEELPRVKRNLIAYNHLISSINRNE